MRVVPEAVHEMLGGLGHHGVVGDLVDPVPLLLGGRQFAEQQQVSDLEEGAVLRQIVDVVSAIAKNAFVAVDESDLALAASRVHEGGIVGHEPEIIGTGFESTQLSGPDSSHFYRELQGLIGALVGDS